MTKLQFGLVFSAFALLLMLYFGFDTTSPKHKGLEKTRALAAVSTDINVLMTTAKKQLESLELAPVLALERQLAVAPTDSVKSAIFKQLSGTWYDLKKPGIAGYYAGEAAGLAGTEESWSIAGTTYSICLQQAHEKKIKSYCTAHAIQAFENAISLNPGNPQNKLNLALVYVQNPPSENPMKGVLMLLNLNKTYPENVAILNNLGRLAIKTSQFDKAVQRLEKAHSIDADNQTTICLLAQAYRGLGKEDKAEEFIKKCKTPPDY